MYGVNRIILQNLHFTRTECDVEQSNLAKGESFFTVEALNNIATDLRSIWIQGFVVLYVVLVFYFVSLSSIGLVIPTSVEKK